MPLTWCKLLQVMTGYLLRSGDFMFTFWFVSVCRNFGLLWSPYFTQHQKILCKLYTEILFSRRSLVSSSVKLIRVRFRWLPNFTFASVQLWKFFKWFRPSITHKLLLPRDMMLEFENLVQIVSESGKNLWTFSIVFSQKF